MSSCANTTKDVTFWKRKRYLVIFLSFLGFVNLFTMRANLSVAIVAMTEITNSTNEIGEEETHQHFDWDSKQRGFALSSFFYGYILTQFLGGVSASRFGGTLIFGVGICVLSLSTIVTPWLCYQGIGYLYAIRVIEGIFSGLAFPSINAVYAKWSPPLERSRSSGFALSGCFAGTVISMLSSGWLAVVFGWQSIFYLFGIIGLLWTISWFAIVRESPEQDILISHQEREYIKRCLDREGQLKIANPPWRSIFTSKPVYAIAVAHFSYTWGYYTLLTQLPAYMKDILEFDLQNTGFVSSIPFLALSILLFISGYFADRLLIKNWLSITQVRKYFTNISFLAQMIFLMLGAYFQNTTTVIICITLSVGLGSFSISGFLANPLDLAPQYASIIVGFSNTFATLPGLISPILTGYILTTPPNEEEYQKVFYISSGIYLIGIFVYGIFASGKLQNWAVNPRELTITTNNVIIK